MSRVPSQCLAVALALATVSCSDLSTIPDQPTVELAKGGPPQTSLPIAMTFEDAGADLVSDGKGPYQSNVCGVAAAANLDGTAWGFQMSPRGANIPKSQTAACAGIAPRSGTIRLTLKHVSDSPHVDDPAGSGGGTFSLGNLALTAAGGSKINGPTPCYHVGHNGSLSGLGLRLDSQNFPGSNNLIRENLGNGLWHIYTAPYPGNLAYCEGDNGISFWHVVVNIRVQILGS